MPKRVATPNDIETRVLTASGRRCCLCFFLHSRDDVRKGQIAHLNRESSDSSFENLVWLCFDHHDEYDSRTSQSKGLKISEVRAYRDKLYEIRQSVLPQNLGVQSIEVPESEFDFEEDRIRAQYKKLRLSYSDLSYLEEPWRYPLWQVGNRPEYFAYKAGNRSDGVCLIERIDLPDGRIVMACIQTAGNPGNSITNCAEELCFQICERFGLPANRIVWLQHYDDWDLDDKREWTMVRFGKIPPRYPFADPTWEEMTPELWKGLWLKPKRRMTKSYLGYDSKIIKLFPWASESLI